MNEVFMEKLKSMEQAYMLYRKAYKLCDHSKMQNVDINNVAAEYAADAESMFIKSKVDPTNVADAYEAFNESDK